MKRLAAALLMVGCTVEFPQRLAKGSDFGPAGDALVSPPTPDARHPRLDFGHGGEPPRDLGSKPPPTLDAQADRPLAADAGPPAPDARPPADVGLNRPDGIPLPDGGPSCRGIETCNFVDDDCDGRTDEGLRNACGVCGPTFVEVCNGADDDCDEIVDGPGCRVCEGVPEACNGVDDDCDGLTDEGLRNACGGCGPTPREACNGVDDDCDGLVDEDPGMLNACGRCGPLPVEICNGVDDDCDGMVDEDCMPCPDRREVCNGVDDDCDGETDEGVRTKCGVCGTPVREICDQLDNDCDGETDEGQRNRCGACGPDLRDPPTAPNRYDDDCNGVVDG